MSEAEVAGVAQLFYDSQASGAFQGLRVVSVRPYKNEARRWVVLFSGKMADGSVIDSPPTVLVNDETAVATFLQEF